MNSPGFTSSPHKETVMVMSLMQKRRSIRKFQLKPVESEKIDRLVEAALRAPSSRGKNPWQFLVVTDRQRLAELSQAKEHGSAFLDGAPLGFVVCGDPSQSDVWIEDCSIACTFIQLAAESLGLGSCWIQLRERMHGGHVTAESYVSKILDLPEHLKVEAIIAVGYPDEEKAPHSLDTLHYNKVHHDRYGRPYR